MRSTSRPIGLTSASALRKDLGQQLHSQWIKPIQLGTFCKETGTLDMFLPTEFSANWVQDRFADRLSLAWKIARPDVRNVRIQVHPGRRQLPELRLGSGGNPRPPANDGPVGGAESLSLVGDDFGALGQGTIGLDPTLTFANFVTGTGNVLACNAAQRMAAIETPQFSPLYLKAATGQGKTHLLHAIGHAYLAEPPARADLLLLGRTLHGRVRPGAAPEPDDGVQGAAARLRPAAGR